MTGTIAEFFADLREATKDDDPLVDLDTLPPQIIEPIRDFANAYRAKTGFAGHARLFGVQFTARRGPLIRYSKLMGVYDKFTTMALAGERAAKQRAAQIEAETGLASVEGRAERLMRAETEAASRLAAEQQLRERERVRFADQIHNLTAQNKRLSGENEMLARQVGARTTAPHPATAARRPGIWVDILLGLAVAAAGLVLVANLAPNTNNTPLPSTPIVEPPHKPKPKPPPEPRFAALLGEATALQNGTVLWKAQSTAMSARLHRTRWGRALA